MKILVLILFFFPSVYSFQAPVWKKDIDRDISRVIISEKGDLVGVIARYKVYLFDKDGNEIFSINMISKAPTIGFYNYSNNWFYCVYPKNFFYDDGLEEPREFETVNYKACITKVIHNEDHEASHFNVSEIYLSEDIIFDNTGRRISDRYRNVYPPGKYVPVNPLALIGDSIFSAYFDDNVLNFDVWELTKILGGWVLKRNDSASWVYGLVGTRLSLDMSKDGRIIAVGSNDDYVYLFNNSGGLLWKYKTGGDVYKVLISKNAPENLITVASRDGFFYKFDEEGNILARGEISKNVAAISRDGIYVKIVSDSQGRENRGISYYYPANLTISKPRLIVLANSIDKDHSLDILKTLEKDMKVVYSNATNFLEYQREKYILILGGPMAYEGIGEIVKEVLNDYEENSIINGTNTDIIIKNNVWGVNQKIFIIGGKNREETERLFKYNKEKIKI
jgi:hypothetical protein